MQKLVKLRFTEVEYEIVGGFFFLRFLCPAIIAPKAYDLDAGAYALSGELGRVGKDCTIMVIALLLCVRLFVSYFSAYDRGSDLSVGSRRTLILIGKVLQNLSNCVPFGIKEVRSRGALLQREREYPICLCECCSGRLRW